MIEYKNIVTAALLAFVFASIVFLVFQENTSSAVPPVEGVTSQEDQVVAYYFHGKARCITCQRLEAYAYEALEVGFSRELNDGQLVWSVVDTSRPENRHFLTDYGLKFQAVVLVEVKGGQQRWRNLDQVWDKVGNKEEYIAYVQSEVNHFLAE